MKSSRLLLEVDGEASGSLELARWLLKPPKPSATQIQEPKMKVVPSSSTTLVKLNDAIEFFGGSSMATLPGAPAVGGLPPRPPRDTLKVVSFVGRMSPRLETRRCKGT
jgi:hypothetical protein